MGKVVSESAKTIASAIEEMTTELAAARGGRIAAEAARDEATRKLGVLEASYASEKKQTLELPYAVHFWTNEHGAEIVVASGRVSLALAEIESVWYGATGEIAESLETKASDAGLEGECRTIRTRSQAQLLAVLSRSEIEAIFHATAGIAKGGK